ncbi:MAG: PilZ domain-containing protein [Elusimicrobia bacterium]|nr:PilZ domain-containing protein [Elusimicrobiota bacterium]
MADESSFFNMAESINSDKRKYPRVIYTAGVDITSAKNCGISYKGLIKNISLGGIFVETENQLVIGDGLTFTFLLSGKNRVKASGKIVWEYKNENSNYYGVQFTSIGFLSRFRLKRFINRKLKI